jgi:hypothetical protein
MLSNHATISSQTNAPNSNGWAWFGFFYFTYGKLTEMSEVLPV